MVVVDDNRIAKVSLASRLVSPSVEMNLIAGYTLMPGLIDMRASTSGGGYHGYERLKLTDERRVLGVSAPDVDGGVYHRA